MNYQKVLKGLKLDRDKVLSLLIAEEKVRMSDDYIKRCDEVSHIPDGWLHVTKCIQQEVAYSFGFTDEITNILAVNIMRNALEIFPEDLEIKNSVVKFRENIACQGIFKVGDIIPDFDIYSNENKIIKLGNLLSKDKPNLILAGSHT